MLATPWIAFDSPALLAAGIVLAAAAGVVALARRATMRGRQAVLCAVGLLAFAIAAGGPRVGSDANRRVAVMVDTSASTEGATFRDPAALQRRVNELIGDRPRVVVQFGTLQDRATTWTPPPPDASAVLLFSDGRFEPPATAPPVFAVIDPALERPRDAAVTSLERRGDRVVVTTTNDGPPREMEVTGVRAATRPVAPTGTRTMTFAVNPTATSHHAQIARGDRWPENDELYLMRPPPNRAERWWVSQDGSPPGAGWRTFTPGALPDDPAAYLAPSVIVLDNVDATSLPIRQWLGQYVRDLGGGLLILGGDRAFAAGGYEGSEIGSLSPLASSPPSPEAHWTFLLDASGSMAGEANLTTRFELAVASARVAIGQLPPNDVLNVGRFAEELHWWTRGKSVKEFGRVEIPTPRGPTNLDAALRAVVATLDKSVANHVVLLTDGQVQLPALDELARVLKAANARVHVLAVNTGPGLDALRRLAAETRGTFAEETDASHWGLGLSALLRQAAPRHWMTTPANVQFADLPPTTAAAWNRTWLKAGADELARATVSGDPAPMAARANVGAGQVAAVAFRPPDGHVEKLASRVQAVPRDPRLRVTWRAGRQLVVEIDAADDAAPINGLSPTLVLAGPNETRETFAVPQTGAGQYAIALLAPRMWSFATVREAGRVIDRFAVPGRYGPEVDGIGNDRAALRELAQRTGGRVIQSGDRASLDIATRRPAVPIGQYFAVAGALLVTLGLIAWRTKL